MKRFILTAAVMLSLVLGALAFVAATEPGLVWLFGRLQGFLPADLEVDSLQGRLIGPLEVDGLRCRSLSLDLDLQHGSVDWQPLDLFFKRAHITSCNLSGLRIKQNEKKEKSPSVGKELKISLPLSIFVRELNVRDISVVRPDGAPPILISEIRLRALAEQEHIQIDDFHAEAPEGQIKVTGYLKPQADYPADLKLTWRLHPKGFSPMVGTGSLSGTLKKLDAALQMESPAAAIFQAKAFNLLSVPRWTGSLKVEEASLRDFKPSWPQVTVTADVKGDGTQSQIRLGGSLQAREPDYGKLSGEFDLKKADQTWQLDKLLLTRPDSSTHIELTGEYATLDGRAVFKADGRWASLSWPLTAAKAAIASDSGKFSLSGSPDQYEISMEAAVAGRQIPAGQWTVRGNGNSSRLVLNEIRASLLGGDLEGSGEIGWRPVIEWKTTLAGTALNPGLQWSRWSGELDLNASSSGVVKNRSPKFSLELHHLKGRLRDYPFEASGRMDNAGTVYHLSNFRVVSGSSELHASGSLGQEWDVVWELKTPQLGELLPDSQGFLAGKGTVTGLREKPTIAMAVRGTDVVFGPNRVADLTADLDFDLQDRDDSHLDLKVSGLTLARRSVETATLQGTGKLDDHELAVKIVTDQEAFDLRLDGNYRDKLWQGSVEHAYLASIPLGVWELAKAAAFRISPAEAEIEDLCWANNGAGACMGVRWHEGTGLKTTVSITETPLAVFQSRLPAALEINGYLTGNAALAFDRQKVLTGEVNLKTTAGSLRYLPGTEEPIELPFQDAMLDAQLDDKGMKANLKISLDEVGSVTAATMISPFTPFELPAEQKRMTGHVKADMSSLAILAGLFPEIHGAAGSFSADMRLSGNMAKPVVTGSAAINEASATLPRLGIRLSDIRLTAENTGGTVMTIDGEMKSGQGTLQIGGAVHLDPRQGFPSKLTLKGSNIELINLPEAWAIASPDLAFDLDKEKIELTGTVVIPEARIAPLDFSAGVPVSRDVIILGEAVPALPEEKREIIARVRITLGKKVRFEGFGLSGNITGSVLAVDMPEKFTTGQGELQVVEGKYKAYGQNLVIERGKLLFTGGPIDDPGLDVKAVRKTGDVVSGVNVRGTLKDPQMELFSSPSLDQTDALSYLVLGQPSRQATGAEGEALYGAALSLGVSGGGFLADQIGSAFGIGDVEIEQEGAAEEATVFIGKYLSPRLYVSYGIGLFEPISTLRLRYTLSSKWQVQTEYGIESGADLIYTIERD
jgi:translocation and assembly module TamB